MSEPGSLLAPELPQELIELRRQFVSRLPARIDEIAELFHALSDGRWEAGSGETLHRMVHSLTGTAGTFGLHDISRTARRLETRLASMIDGADAPSDVAWRTLSTDMALLHELGAAQRPARQTEAVAAPVQPARSTTLIHLVIDDAATAERLRLELLRNDFHAEVFASPQAFHRVSLLPDTRRPAAVVMDITGPDSAAGLPGLIQQLGLADNPDIPLLVGLSEGDLTTRIAVNRAGARHSLPQPLDPERLVDALNSLTGGAPERPWRVLLVDDEPLVLQAHAVYLKQAGMDVRTLTDPMQTLEEVQRFEPDVLVIDVYMPEVNGPEIAAALRESDVCPQLAIIFLSAETDMTQQLVALDLGGDDFLIKPVQPRHLVAAVIARARRARQNKIVQNRLETTLYERQREHLALDQHAIVSMSDARGNITYANDLFCEVSGYNRDEVLGQNHRIIKADLHPPAFFADMWATILDGRVWQGEICNRRRDGRLFWVECTITPFMDTQGKPYQFVSIRTDITHIKSAEAALRMQRDMQGMISEAAARLMAAPAHQASQAIEAALQASGELLGADHAYLFRVRKDGQSMRNTHHWSAVGQKPPLDKLAQVPIHQFAWMRNWFAKEGIAVIPDIEQLAAEAVEEREAMVATRTRALIASPLLKKNQIAGFVGYSSEQPMPQWTPEICALLNILSDVISGALARQRAETALRESEARLSFLVSSSPVTIYTRSTETPFSLTYVSPNIEALMGLDATAFTEQPLFWDQQVHPEDMPRIQGLAGQWRIGEVQQIEYRLRNKDGSYRWVQDQLRMAQDEASGERKLVGYWMDITERKRIEGELSRFNQELEQRVTAQTQSVIESERFARATLDALDARVAILDHSGNILAVNRAWREAGGGEATAAMLHEGRNYLMTCDDLCGVPSEGSRPIAMGIQSVIEGTSGDFFHEYACPFAAEPRWFVCRVKRFPGDGAVRVVVSHEDITAMKLIERQQMRSQRLESLGTLAGGVAHDLNNSLAPILMGMGILQDQYPEEQQLINMIHNSAKRGADMVRQLLAFAKGVDGKRVALQAEQLVVELESLMKGSFPKSIEVQVQLEPKLPKVLGDATQLHQILLNLCVNARDAMPHGGKLTVQAKSVETDTVYARSVTEAKPGRYVCLRVSDTGEGIPPDLLDPIFDPFFTTKAQEKGTGLGLSTVLGIVKGHGGFVQVHSTQGKGTTFAVFLPVAMSEAGSAALEESNVQAYRGQGETVLFVDDEPALREIGKTVLERLNFLPLIAMDGEDGLIKATENRSKIKAIITDMHMPHMDGLAFVHAVRRSMPHIPIILASGRVDDAVAMDFRALGVTARLDKPFTEAQLAEKLKSMLVPGA